MEGGSIGSGQEYVVYIDVFFVINVCFDFILLNVTNLFLKKSNGGIRILFGALVGGLYSVFVLVFGLRTQPMGLTLGNIGCAALMTCISFQAEAIRHLIKQTIQFYIVTVIFGGIMNMLYYTTYFGVILRNLLYGNTDRAAGITMIPLVGIAVVTYFLLKGSLYFLNHWKQEQKNHYQVRVIMGQKEIRCKALFDTGNGLREPISGEQVHIAEYEQLQPLWNQRNEMDGGLYVIPYQAVGTETGVLYGIRVDCMIIGEYEIKKPMIAVYKGKLSARGDYGMILNSEIFEDCPDERRLRKGE